ncbi:MAG TPA: hypothetical protein PK530_18240, partial [Anaerolineales bacterium]|nr:hypothetical protein [Anaerolineales bacterium]
QWMQTLHQYGLLTGRFARTGNWLRSAPHHRAQLLEHRAPHILHMQKALLQMNVQLSQALTDVTGLKGLTILRAIVTGERDPQTLAAYWDPGCKKSAAEIGHALTGTWRAEHLFILQQALQLYDFYPQQLEACDAEIERMYAVTRPAWVTEAVAPLPAGKRKTHSKNAPPNQEAPASKTAQWRGSERHRGVWCVFGVNRDDGMWDGHAPVSHRKALFFLVRGRPET